MNTPSSTPSRTTPLRGRSLLAAVALAAVGAVLGAAIASVVSRGTPVSPGHHQVRAGVGVDACGGSIVEGSTTTLEDWAAGADLTVDVTCAWAETTVEAAAERFLQADAEMLAAVQLDGSGMGNWQLHAVLSDHVLTAVGSEEGRTRVTVGERVPGLSSAIRTDRYTP